MEDRYTIIDKAVGETPLVRLERFRVEANIAPDMPLTYAGRLDPMASGALLILIGEACKRQEEYRGLDKEYEFAVLFGVRSDTGDILGLVSACDPPSLTEDELRRTANDIIGTHEFTYPRFSSKTVYGKPLHAWAREGRLNEIDVPTYTGTVRSLSLLGLTEHTIEDIHDAVLQKLAMLDTVPGNDFREPEVRASWASLCDGHEHRRFHIARFRCTASAGTYMRTLAEEIARHLGTCGLAYSIHRTRICMPESDAHESRS